MRTARDALTVVRAVRTIWPQVDHALGVGGWPLERCCAIHGPSAEGKTLMMLGLVYSFLAQGHFALLVDAERTTPITWVRQLFGDLAESDRFLAIRPESYEACVERVREFCETVARMRDARQVPADATGIVVVDSLRKLVPKDLMKRLQKEEGKDDKKKGGRVLGGRAGQLRAKLNSEWYDELVPLMERTGCTWIAVTREYEDPDADAWTRKFGNDYRIGGGRSVVYESSLLVRVERDAYVTTGSKDAGTLATVGERHRLTVKKTKIAERDERNVVTYFHSQLSPPAFDLARDAADFGQRMRVVERSGSSVAWKKGGKRWRTEAVFVEAMRGEPEILAEIVAEIRQRCAESDEREKA